MAAIIVDSCLHFLAVSLSSIRPKNLQNLSFDNETGNSMSSIKISSVDPIEKGYKCNALCSSVIDGDIDFCDAPVKRSHPFYVFVTNNEYIYLTYVISGESPCKKIRCSISFNIFVGQREKFTSGIYVMENYRVFTFHFFLFVCIVFFYLIELFILFILFSLFTLFSF
jgi:hypothetical protein